MALTPEKLRTVIRRSDKKLDGISEDVVREIERFFSNYISRVKAMLNDMAAESPTEELRLREATEMAQDLDRILAEAGYDDVRRRYVRSFTPVAREALEYYRELGVKKPYSGIDGQVINALRNGFVNDLDLRIDSKLVQPLRERIIQSTVALRTRKEVIADITKTINNEGILRRDGRRFYDFNTEVLVNDSHRRFYRSVRTQKADDLGLEIYWYKGPDDSRTRPVCHDILNGAPHGVPGMYYRDEINAGMVAGLKHNPMTSGGGWNCRHTFFPVTRDYAKAQGFQFRAGDEDIEEEQELLLA